MTFIGDRPNAVFSFVNRLELDALDLRFRLQPDALKHPDPRIIIVDIDQRSQEVLGRWPFSRTYFAKMLDALREDGAKVAAFDITFSKPDETAAPIRELRKTVIERQKQGGQTDPRVIADIDRLSKEYDGDEQFARAIERFGKVVLGNFFLYSEYDLKGVDDNTLDRYANILADFPFPELRPVNPQTGKRDLHHLIQQFADPDPYPLMPKGTQANIEILSDALRKAHGATGFFNVEPDPDGVVRQSLLVLPYGRTNELDTWDLYASLDVQAVKLFEGVPDQNMKLDFSETGVAALEFGPSLVIHPDALGRMMIRYEGGVATYPYVSIADVVQRNSPPGTFKGKIVLVGASATGIGDLRSTPFGGINYPGVEIHANVIDNISEPAFPVSRSESGCRGSAADISLRRAARIVAGAGAAPVDAFRLAAARSIRIRRVVRISARMVAELHRSRGDAGGQRRIRRDVSRARRGKRKTACARRVPAISQPGSDSPASGKSRSGEAAQNGNHRDVQRRARVHHAFRKNWTRRNSPRCSTNILRK